MEKFHAVMIGEDGAEFPASVVAANKDDAEAHLRENHPESTIRSIRSSQSKLQREADAFTFYAHGGNLE